jgi:hypothetical protein
MSLGATPGLGVDGIFWNPYTFFAMIASSSILNPVFDP